MINYCFHIRFFVFLCLSAATTHAMPLASAKVLLIQGTASYGTLGEETLPLTEGTILFEGDSVVTGKKGVVYVIFSNGAGLTIEKNSNVVLTKLEQRAFWKDNPEEIPREEISKSTTVLTLKYGNIRGHVDGLRKDSEFRINTIMGDAMVAGKTFFIELYYDSIRRDFVLNVQNINGMIDLITKFSGSLRFGRNPVVVKSYDAKADDLQVVRIPPKRVMSVRKSSLSNLFSKFTEDFPSSTKSRLITDFEEIEPFLVDQQLVSPNGSQGI